MYTITLTQSELDLLIQFCNSDIPIAAKGARIVAGLHVKLETTKPDKPSDDTNSVHLPET